MKKAIALFLALVMCLSLVACGNSNGEETHSDKTQAQAPNNNSQEPALTEEQPEEVGNSEETHSDNTQVQTPDNNSQEPAPTEEEPEEVDLSLPINISTADGDIVYTGFEVANKELAKGSESYGQDMVIFKFDFTSQKDLPVKYSGVFSMKFYQNGVQIDELNWICSDGGDHYELCGNSFDEVLKGGKISFGRPVILTDWSPVTIMVTYHEDNDIYQMMVVDIAAE